MRLIMFDLDGTLVDSAAHIVGTIQTAFADAGMTVPPASAITQTIGLSLPDAMAQLGDGDRLTTDTLVESYRAAFFRRRDECKLADSILFPNVLEVIKDLAARPDHILGVATGKSLAGLRRVLGDHAIEPLFATLQTPDHNPSKPHPGMLFSAFAAVGARPEQTVMIGDTTFDMDMARAARTASIGVTWGNHAETQLRASGASRIVRDMSQLISAIDSVFETPRDV